MRRGEMSVGLQNLNIYYTWKKYFNIENNRFKITTRTSNDKFELPDVSYSILDIK